MSSDASFQQLKAAFASISPYFWLFSLGGAISPFSPLSWGGATLPFSPLSWGGAISPSSPLSWGYSTWLLFIIPFAIAVFAPTRTFSGPLRFAYLEYTTKVTSLLGALLGSFAGVVQSLPTLALPVFFFIPVLPMLFFILLPALPVAWHYAAYHYRIRLNKITTTAADTTARLDLALARARRAAALAHTYENQVLDVTSSTCRTASLTLKLHDTDFFDTAVEAWAAIGHTVEHAELAVTAARDVVGHANGVLRSGSSGDGARPGHLAEVLVKRASDAETAASKASQLARTAQGSVERSKKGQQQAEVARKKVTDEARGIRDKGIELAKVLANIETQVIDVENEVESVRTKLATAVANAVEGEMGAADDSIKDAQSSYNNVTNKVQQLGIVAGQARTAWTTLAVYVSN